MSGQRSAATWVAALVAVMVEKLACKSVGSLVETTGFLSAVLMVDQLVDLMDDLTVYS